MTWTAEDDSASRESGASVPEALIAAAVFLAPLSGVSIPFIGYPRFLVFVGLVALLASLVRREPLGRYVISAFSILYVAVVAWATSGYATEPAVASQNSVLLVTIASGGLLIAAYASQTADRVRRFSYAFVAGCVVLSASMWLLDNQIANRYYGLAKHPVETGGSLATGIAVATALFLATGRRRSRQLLLAAILVMVSGILRAEALTGLLAALVGLGVVALLVRGRAFGGGILAGVAAVAAGAAVLPQAEVLISKLTSQVAGLQAQVPIASADSANTLASRIVTMRLGAEQSIDHPITGRGLSPLGTQVLGHLNPHCVFIYALLAGGILLLSPYLLLFASLMRAVIRERRAVRRGDINVYSIALVSGACAGWAAALTGPQLFEPVWLLPALLVVFLPRTGSGVPRTAAGDSRRHRAETSS